MKLCIVMGMLLVPNGIKQIGEDLKLEDAYHKFMFLNKSLKFFLMALAVLITFTVLTTDAMRKAILTEVYVENFSMVPVEFVYLYGLQFTVILAILYLPIFFELRAKGERLFKYYSGDKTDDNKDRETLTAFKLKETALDNLQVSLSILAPLVSSLLPEMLNF